VFTVFNIVDGSPAAEAGLQIGDQIRRINGWPTTFFSLGDMIRKLRARKGKKIKLMVDRDGELLKFEFRLRNLI
jgi:C-terminal processing protease CtpA/Prc